jgi:hypothetical protein
VRRLSLDQYEFEPPDSEQMLELAISSPNQHPDLCQFLEACGASAGTGNPPPARWPKWPQVVESVRQFAGLELPPADACKVIVLSDDWDDVELVVVVGSLLFWYHWWTSA